MRRPRRTRLAAACLLLLPLALPAAALPRTFRRCAQEPIAPRFTG